MKLRASATGLLLFFLSACGDDGDRATGSKLDGSMTDSATHESSLPDGGGADAGVIPPERPAQLKLQFASGSCLGDCPVFTVSIDQTGRVEYQGGLCTARPGVFTKQIPPTGVYNLYARLWQAGYWKLRDHYQNTQDGCHADVADVASHGLSVSADGTDKSLSYSESCTGVPSLDAVTRLAPKVQEVAQVSAWISSDSSRGELFNCGAGYEFPLELKGTYRLALGDRVIGLLTLAGSRADWRLTDCSGQPIGMGNPVMEPRRWILLGPITLPSDAGSLGSIVLSPADDAGIRARGMRADDELVLTATPGTSCTI
ncbi:MAG TPA: DUF6438 domain-containing protein [Polyangiales bacterium]